MNLLPEIGRATLWLAVLGWLVPMLVFRGAGQDRLGRILRSGALAVAALTGAWSLTGTTGLPLALLAPVLAVMLSLPPPAYPWLVLSLLIGTPALSMIGAFGAALTVG
ncbi:MAG: heme exporter protein CcmB, partial [Myxococcota bacterium]